MANRIQLGLKLLAVLLLSCAAFSLCGCVPLGVAAYVVEGQVPVPAEYDLPRQKTLVFVENYVDPDASEDDADVLERYIINDLRKHMGQIPKKGDKKAKPPLKLVDSIELYDLRTADPAKFHKMKIQEIGRALGAKQVLYVSLITMNVQQMGQADLMRGTAGARLKVINATNGETMWPQESSEGYPVGFESKLITPQENVTYEQARDTTMRTLSHDISRLFYKWKPDDEENDSDFEDPGTSSGGG